jgi:addiction module RelE/StbE family toxin
MKLRFTPRATRDLAEIAEYIHERSPSAAVRVRSIILQSLEDLLLFPELGRRQTLQDVRKLVTRKYSYLVYYRIDRANDEIIVLTIQHHARRREYEDL